MSRIIKAALWSGLAALALAIFSPAPQASAADRLRTAVRPRVADPYWTGYWRWYDRDYRPYYHRHHYRHGGYDHRYYDRALPRYHDYRYPYGYPYRDGRYYRRPSGGVQVGPLGIYW